MKNAVVLVSGGMDSAVVLAIAREQGFAVHALSVRYGQRHTSELEAADRVATALGAVAHKTVNVDLRSIGGSALTDDIDVPLDLTLANAIGNGKGFSLIMRDQNRGNACALQDIAHLEGQTFAGIHIQIGKGLIQ